MDVTAQIIGSMFELQRIIRQRMMHREEPNAVNMHQMHTLVFIQENPNITMSSLAKILHISQASATPLVARLQKMGLVRRATDRKNRTMVRLQLTEKGKKHLNSSLQVCQKELHDIFSRIPADDRKQFSNILLNLVTSINSSPKDL